MAKRHRGAEPLALAALAVLAANPAWSAPAQRLTIENVNVIPMTGDSQIIHGATVEIADGRIVSVSGKGRCHAHCIDGRGKWLIPGLTDAHVHLENDRLLQLYMHLPKKIDGAVQTADVFLPYIAHGVTQVFDLSAMTETFQQKSDIESGRVLGPHIVTAAMLDGPKPIWPEGMSHAVADPEAGRQAVRDASDQGYDLIKAYGLLDLPSFLAIVDEAGKRGMKVIGHIPGREKGMTAKFFVPGYSAVAHAEEFALQTRETDESRIPDYIEMSRASHTALVATLTLDDRILEETENPASLKSRDDLAYENPLLQQIVQDHNPYVALASPGRIDFLRKLVAFNRKLVKEFSDAGIPVLAGTDSPVPGIAPGFALPDELEALTAAGLTPYQALTSATRAPCAWLGANCGSIEPGRRADLLLLDGDPTRDISNVRRISAVIVGGEVHPSAELQARMAQLKMKNAKR